MLGVRSQIEVAARKVTFFTAGGVLCTVGAAFLTVAAWLLLEDLYDALTAATVLGCVYLGIGLIVVSRGMTRPVATPPVPPPVAPRTELSPLQEVAVSFVKGVESGLARKPTHKP